MSENKIHPVDPWIKLDETIQAQLELQVKLSFQEHRDYLNINGLHDCKNVLDFGCGSGSFLNRLAEENPLIQFTGVDKRQYLLDRADRSGLANTKWIQADLAAGDLPEIFGRVDGIIMRYVLLHIPGGFEVLRNLLKIVKQDTKIWIIDVDLATFRAEPKTAKFEILRNLVKQFCEIHSIDTMAGQSIGKMLEALEFQKITSHHSPFSSRTMPLHDFAQFIKNEMHLYAELLGWDQNSSDNQAIHDFIAHEIETGKTEVDYGMILWNAEFPAHR